MAKSITFKGAPKPFGKSGHFNEPRRHSLQAKGFKTGTHTGSPIDFSQAKPKGRLVNVRVYKFEELSPKAKEKALEDQRQVESELWDANDYLIPKYEEELAEFGISGIKVNYSGFYSQGDGASFTGLIDLKQFIKKTGKEKEYAELLKRMENGDMDDSVKIERIDYQNSHWNTIRSGSIDANDEKLQEKAEELERDVNEFIWKESKMIYKDMQEDFEYRMEDKNLKESIEANDYEFKANGSMFHEVTE